MSVKMLRRGSLFVVPMVGLVLLTSSVASALPVSEAPGSVVHTTYFAGYNASVATSVQKVTGTLTVPTVTCPASGYANLNSGVILSGPGSMFTEVFIICSNGTMPQPPLFEVGVNGTSGPDKGGMGSVWASPGDKLSFTLKQSASSATLVGLIEDKTTGYSASATGPGSIDPVAGMPLSVEAGTMASGNGSGSTVVPAFAPGFTIGSLRIGTSTLTSFSPTKSEMFHGATLQISTSKISTGGSFTNAFVHS